MTRRGLCTFTGAAQIGTAARPGPIMGRGAMLPGLFLAQGHTGAVPVLWQEHHPGTFEGGADGGDGIR